MGYKPIFRPPIARKLTIDMSNQVLMTYFPSANNTPNRMVLLSGF